MKHYAQIVLQNNVTHSRALIGLFPCLDKTIQTRKISRQKCTEVCFARSVWLFYERNRKQLLCVWILWFKHFVPCWTFKWLEKHACFSLGCCSTFEKLKTIAKRLVIFLRFSEVSQHPACLDHGIQTNHETSQYKKFIHDYGFASIIIPFFSFLVVLCFHLGKASHGRSP